MKPRFPGLRRALALAVALAIGVGAGFAAHALQPQGSTAPSATRETVPGTAGLVHLDHRLAHAALREDAPGVVTSRSVPSSTASSSAGIPFGNPNADRRSSEAEGTGFEIDSNGNILTAEHVVSGATSIKVTFQDGSTANGDARRLGQLDRHAP